MRQVEIISLRKFIEVPLALDAFNAAAPRVVIFSQLVHDPEDLWRCQNPRVEPNKQVKGHCAAS